MLIMSFWRKVYKYHLHVIFEISGTYKAHNNTQLCHALLQAFFMLLMYSIPYYSYSN